MLCAKCGSTNSSVVDTRIRFEGKRITRRRECDDCRYRWTTHEMSDVEHERIIAVGRRMANTVSKWAQELRGEM